MIKIKATETRITILELNPEHYPRNERTPEKILEMQERIYYDDPDFFNDNGFKTSSFIALELLEEKMIWTQEELKEVYAETIKTKGFTSMEAKTLRALASAIEEKRIAMEDRNMWHRKYHRLLDVINQEINQ